jgi:hypothetical protein
MVAAKLSSPPELLFKFPLTVNSSSSSHVELTVIVDAVPIVTVPFQLKVPASCWVAVGLFISYSPF